MKIKTPYALCFFDVRSALLELFKLVVKACEMARDRCAAHSKKRLDT
jgi:hypothetical protein